MNHDASGAEFGALTEEELEMVAGGDAAFAYGTGFLTGRYGHMGYIVMTFIGENLPGNNGFNSRFTYML